MKRTLWRRGVAAALAISLLASCGSSDEGPTSAAATDGPISLTFWHSLTGVNGAAVDQVVADFNSTVGKEKGIVVESSFQSDDPLEKLKTVAQAGDTENFPDLAHVVGAGIPSVMAMEQTVPIQDFYDKAENVTVPLADLEPNIVRAFSYQNRLIGMPFNPSTILLYYNKDLFEAAGLDPEDPPTTISEMADDAAAIAGAGTTAQWGLNVEVRRYQLANFIGSQGKFNFFGNNEGGRAGLMSEVTFGTDGSLRSYLTEWKKVVDSGGYKPKEDNINEEFASQLFGMAIMSTSRIKTITELTAGKFEFGVANLPKVSESDTGGAAVGGSSLAIFNREDPAKVNAAWEFVQYAATPEVQMKFHIATGYIPVNTKVYDIPEMTEHLKENPMFQVAIDQLHGSNVNVQEPFDIINWELDEIIRTTMLSFGEGAMTIDEAESAIVTQCNEKLAAYARANG